MLLPNLLDRSWQPMVGCNGRGIHRQDHYPMADRDEVDGGLLNRGGQVSLQQCQDPGCSLENS